MNGRNHLWTRWVYKSEVIDSESGDDENSDLACREYSENVKQSDLDENNGMIQEVHPKVKVMHIEKSD